MHRTLLYIPNEIYGIPVFGAGLLLAVWVAFSVGLLLWLGQRQGFGPETWSYLLLLVPVGLIIWWLLPAIRQQQGLPIRGYGAMMLTAVLAATALAAWRARRAGLHHDLIFSMAFWMFVPGIVGARAFYVIEYWSREYWPAYQQEGLGALIREVVNVTEGGLVVYGSFVGGVLGLVLFVRKARLPLLATCDLIAPSMLLGLALGRIGCLLNGCCFGHLCELPWKVTFPFGSPAHLHQAHGGQVFVHGLKIAGDPDHQPVITEVQPGSPADRQGLQAGQQIAEINGVPVETIARATWALLHAEQLYVLIEHEDDRFTRWTLENPAPPARPIYRDRDGRLSILGMELADGQRNRPVIARIESGSLAEAEGLEPGWELVDVSGQPVGSLADVRSLIDAHQTTPWLSIRTRHAIAPVRWTIERPLPRSRPVHPTQIYSSVNALLLCLLLLAYDPFRRRDGELTALLMTLYPITRCLLEWIRTDENPVFGTPLSISQNVSWILLVLAVGIWVYVLRRPREKAFA